MERHLIDSDIKSASHQLKFHQDSRATLIESIKKHLFHDFKYRDEFTKERFIAALHYFFRAPLYSYASTNEFHLSKDNDRKYYATHTENSGVEDHYEGQRGQIRLFELKDIKHCLDFQEIWKLAVAEHGCTKSLAEFTKDMRSLKPETIFTKALDILEAGCLVRITCKELRIKNIIITLPPPYKED